MENKPINMAMAFEFSPPLFPFPKRVPKGELRAFLTKKGGEDSEKCGWINKNWWVEIKFVIEMEDFGLINFSV